LVALTERWVDLAGMDWQRRLKNPFRRDRLQGHAPARASRIPEITMPTRRSQRLALGT
jgi:hypothetical protein